MAPQLRYAIFKRFWVFSLWYLFLGFLLSGT